jgi:hypothetical protein
MMIAQCTLGTFKLANIGEHDGIVSVVEAAARMSF